MLNGAGGCTSIQNPCDRASCFRILHQKLKYSAQKETRDEVLTHHPVVTAEVKRAVYALFGARANKVNKSLDEKVVVPILRIASVLGEALLREHVRNGFKYTGVYPFEPVTMLKNTDAPSLPSSDAELRGLVRTCLPVLSGEWLEKGESDEKTMDRLGIPPTARGENQRPISELTPIQRRVICLNSEAWRANEREKAVALETERKAKEAAKLEKQARTAELKKKKEEKKAADAEFSACAALYGELAKDNASFQPANAADFNCLLCSMYRSAIDTIDFDKYGTVSGEWKRCSACTRMFCPFCSRKPTLVTLHTHGCRQVKKTAPKPKRPRAASVPSKKRARSQTSKRKRKK